MKPGSYCATGALIALFGCVGCKTVVRENILSSINTGIGVTVAENPKTELYEVKVGYIRSQFYSVPTGKVVENENKHDGTETTTIRGTTSTTEKVRNDARSNRADLTPQIVSGIRMESGIEQLLIGVNVSESFAVGSIAVMSPAAIAMYVADADSDAKASAASLAAIASARTVREAPSGDTLQTMAPLMNAYNALQTSKQTEFNEAAKVAEFADFRAFLMGNPTSKQIGDVRAELEKDQVIKKALK